MSSNITESDFRWGTFVWGMVTAVVLSLLVGLAIVSRTADLSFDKTCINNGKSIVWTEKNGQDAKKECK